MTDDKRTLTISIDPDDVTALTQCVDWVVERLRG